VNPHVPPPRTARSGQRGVRSALRSRPNRPLIPRAREGPESSAQFLGGLGAGRKVRDDAAARQVARRRPAVQHQALRGTGFASRKACPHSAPSPEQGASSRGRAATGLDFRPGRPAVCLRPDK